MPLTANREVDHFVDQQLRTFGVKASARIYRGAFVGLSAGFARGLVAADTFAGVAFEEADNSSGGDGDIEKRVYTQGDFDLTLASATKADIGKAVYASADNVLTFTAAANSYVGQCIDSPASGTIILRLDIMRTAP